jgi:endonuclease/exonuclease/phosphatase (EEP) superfamily protein YafD
LIATIAVLTVLASVVLARALDWRSGLPGLAVVLEQHLVLAVGAVLVAVIAVDRSRAQFVVGGVFLIFAIIAFGSEWVSEPRGRAPDLTVWSWNLERGARSPAALIEALRSSTADVIALQELEPDHAGAIEADSVLLGRYPYRELAPDDGYLGIGLLSRYPLSDVERWRDPAGISASVDAPEGEVSMINAHPLPGRISTVLGLPVGFDPSVRDADIARVRERVDAALARSERVLVVGDYNTSPTEPAYDVLAAGLRDAHVEVGQGPGWTWRPSRLEALPLGLLRIDLALIGPSLEPVSSRVDCSLPGDHCRLVVELSIDPQ